MVLTIRDRLRRRKSKSSNRRSHRMPFGAQVLSDKRVHFRLWAPAAKKVELCVQGVGPQVCVQMDQECNGWYGIIRDPIEGKVYYQYRINGSTYVPDPASRFQPDDVEGVSQVINPQKWRWQDQHWRGRPWSEAVIYEIHVGTFTPQGNFIGVKDRLDYLADLGVTALQLMPIADFQGRRNWGYDGALLFAPDSAYGTPDDLKDLIQTAHAKGIMVFLDVVYNHFGPRGNFLHLYAPGFFSDRYHTPWGSAINFDNEGSSIVRQFYIHNALYWLEEYHFDGLRFDSVHAFYDSSHPDIMEELAATVQAGLGHKRHVHLILENDNNAAHYLRPRENGKRPIVAQWNDDIHHVLHVLLTGETSGYYQDYADHTMQHLARCLTQGFAYQGEESAYREGRHRGEPSGNLPPNAFVAFLQNHDQVGNRAFGERLGALCSHQAIRATTVLLLLSPATPLLFMGEEWGANQPFLYFVDFDAELAAAVNQGRLREFAKFPQFKSADSLSKIPPPNNEATFLQSKLDWEDLRKPQHHQWLELYRYILRIRRQAIQPYFVAMNNPQTRHEYAGARGLLVSWQLTDDCCLTLIANLGADSQQCDWVIEEGSELLYATHNDLLHQLENHVLQPWAVGWFISALPRSSTQVPT